MSCGESPTPGHTATSGPTRCSVDSVSELAELTSALVRAESVNPSLDPAGSGEAPAVRVVVDWALEQGLPFDVDELDGRATVRVHGGRGGGRSVMLLGHLDTVGGAAMADPFGGAVRDGCVHGRGAYDMKGGVAAALIAARDFDRERPEGSIVVACAADEEYASLGAERLVERANLPDYVIVCEPTDERLCVAHRGFAGFEIEVNGRAAHGSRPDLGVDAIAATGVVLTRLEQRAADLLAREPHPLLGTPSVHASLISGGQEFSSYPERCLLQGERRTLPGESDDEIAEEVAALASGVDATTRLVFSRPALETDSSHELVEAVAEASGSSVREGVPFWTDGALLAAAGVPTVVFGPRGAGAHAAEEWVEVDSLATCAAVYGRAARLLLRRG
jgi:acetylornithine deacetylase/succinyl-diaminopimelate desuccinylase-like protein